MYRVDVPDKIFLSRGWEWLMRAVFFMLGVTYSNLFGHTLDKDTYIGVPLLLVAFAIMLGRHAAMRRQKKFEEEKAIAEIVAMERASQLAAAVKPAGSRRTV